MKFVKIEACGNDYIYIDSRTENKFKSETPSADWICKICDRHFGVGGDGVVLIDYRDDRYRMHMYNADGTRGAICGNAMRSIAAYLDMTYSQSFPFTLFTDAGARIIDKIMNGPSISYEVDMGTASMIGRAALSDGIIYRVIDVGNKHAVCKSDLHIDEVNKRIRQCCGIKNINVEAYRSLDSHTIEMQVNEYGTGRTLACGSGACAVAYDACMHGDCTFGIPITIRMEGGDVDVLCHKDGNVRLLGGADILFLGEYYDQ